MVGERILGPAPDDGYFYGQQDGRWRKVTEEAPDTGGPWARQVEAWVPITSGTAIFTDVAPPPNPTPDTLWMDSGSDGTHAGRLYVWFADGPRGAAWVQVGGPVSL